MLLKVVVKGCAIESMRIDYKDSRLWQEKCMVGRKHWFSELILVNSQPTLGISILQWEDRFQNSFAVKKMRLKFLF